VATAMSKERRRQHGAAAVTAGGGSGAKKMTVRGESFWGCFGGKVMQFLGQNYVVLDIVLLLFGC